MTLVRLARLEQLQTSVSGVANASRRSTQALVRRSQARPGIIGRCSIAGACRATWKKTHAAAALRKTRSMAWCEARCSEREAARLDLRAFAANPAPAAGPSDDLMERHSGCDDVANSQLVLAAANRCCGLITGGASWPGCQTAIPPISRDYRASPEPSPERRMQAEPATGSQPGKSLPVPSSSRTAGSSPSDASLRGAWHPDNLTRNPASAADHAVNEGQAFENAAT
jgi:hypothetical protein